MIIEIGVKEKNIDGKSVCTLPKNIQDSFEKITKKLLEEGIERITICDKNLAILRLPRGSIEIVDSNDIQCFYEEYEKWQSEIPHRKMDKFILWLKWAWDNL